MVVWFRFRFELLTGAFVLYCCVGIWSLLVLFVVYLLVLSGYCLLIVLLLLVLFGFVGCVDLLIWDLGFVVVLLMGCLGITVALVVLFNTVGGTSLFLLIWRLFFLLFRLGGGFWFVTGWFDLLIMLLLIASF